MTYPRHAPVACRLLYLSWLYRCTGIRAFRVGCNGSGSLQGCAWDPSMRSVSHGERKSRFALVRQHATGMQSGGIHPCIHCIGARISLGGLLPVSKKGSYFPFFCFPLTDPSFGGFGWDPSPSSSPDLPRQGILFSLWFATRRRSATSSPVSSTSSPTRTCARVASVLDTEAPRRHHTLRSSRKQAARTCTARKTAETGVERRASCLRKS